MHRLGITADLADTSIDDVWFLTQPSNRLTQFVPEFVEIVTADVLEFNVLEILPDALDRIQIWCIAWQGDKLNIARSPLCQKGFDLTIMDRRAIPDNQQFGANLAAQMLEEAHNIAAGECTVLAAQIQLATCRKRANQRAMIATECLRQDRRLTDRRIGAYHRGEQIEAGLIDKDKRAPLG